MKKLLLGFALIALGMASGAWAGNNTLNVTTAPPATASVNTSFTVAAELRYVFPNDCGNRVRVYVSSGSCSGGSASWVGSTWKCDNSELAAVSYSITMAATATAACVIKVEGTDTNVANGAPPTQTYTVYFPRTLAFTPTTPAGAGTTATLTSTASVGAGTKTYSSSTPAVCTVSGTTVTYIAGGTCSLTASIASDGIYAPVSTSANVTVTAFSQLTISSAASASMCSSGIDVTIAGANGAGATVTSYTGTITLSTSTGHGTWSKKTASGTLTAGSDTGAATYTMVAGDSGDAVLTLTDTHPESLTITASDAANGLSKTSSSITFSATSPCKLVVSASTSATTCAALPVTVSATDAGGTLLPYYTGTVSISTSTGHGNWAKTTASGTLTGGSSDNGAASYGFVTADAGDTVFGLTNTHADDLTITASDGTLTVTSSTISFRDNAFVISAASSDVVAGRNHAFTATMMTRSGTGGADCTANAAYTGSKDLKAWITRDGADPSGTAPSIGAVSLPSSVPGSNNLSGVTFSSGVYSFNLSTTDVGKYAINLRDDSGAFTTSVINGSSSTYVVRPFGFAINTGAGSTAADHTGTAFKKAGASFSTTVTAVQYDSNDDTADSNGVPDSGADLTNNSATASFNASTSLTHTLALPSGGAAGTLSGGGALTGFSSGAKTVSLSYSEVGIINLAASSTNYLGGGTNVTGSQLNVGRFYPDHFAASGGIISPFCTANTDFTYMGQPFDVDVTLTAQNSSNATTANYTGNFAFLDLVDDDGNPADNNDVNFVAANAPPTPVTSLTSRLTVNSSSGSWNNGSASVSSTLTLARAATADGPYNSFHAGMAPQDSDGVTLATSALNLDSDANSTSDALSLGSMALRYGRFALDNAVGSELSALAVPARFEYYAGSTAGFAINSDDDIGCSAASLASGDFTLSGWTGSGAAPGLTAASGSTDGQMDLTLAAPGSGNGGTLTLTGSGIAAWLQFNWDGSDADDEPPTAQAVFGINPGSAPVIYRREGFRN